MKNLLTSISPSVLDGARQIIHMHEQGASYSEDVLPVLLGADKLIDGAGTHHSVLLGDRYCYPYNEEFEGVLRPLRYVIAELGLSYKRMHSARFFVQNSGGHLEGCLKMVSSKRLQGKPLGTLLGHKSVQARFASLPLNAMISFTKSAVNPAKHDYHGQGPEPLFLFADAVYSYFLARHFGALLLGAANKLEPLISAITRATEDQSFFRGDPLPVPQS